MKTKKWVSLLSFIIAFLSVSLNLAAQDMNPVSRQGQSTTLLPDGRALLLGGFEGSRKPSAYAFLVGTAGEAVKLTATLNVPRAGHTASVLPDGTVFIFGGVGDDGQIVSTAELFDPVAGTFSVLADVLAVPRAFHTATLLTDGTLLLAGGIEAGNTFPDDVQLWDFRTRKALSQHALLMIPREGHTATLLADGAVRLSGGTDYFGRPIVADEIYDPSTRRFRFANQSENAQQDTVALQIAESIPVDGGTDVPIDSFMAIRTTRLLAVANLRQHFVLTGPGNSEVQVKVTGAESGRLVFVLPSSPLQPGTTYSLQISSANDLHGNVLNASMTFTTAGEPAPQPGPDWLPNTSWTAPDGTAQFQHLQPLQAPSGETALAGQVLKLNGWPLEHVTLEMDGKRAESDRSGRFLLRNLTAGHHILWIDGTTANDASGSYGIYEVGVTIFTGRTNVLNYTIWMTRLDMADAVTIPSPTTSETVITTPEIPGLEVHLPAGTVITDRTGKVVRQVSITPVPINKPPFPLPPGVQVPLYFTVQPGGAYINVSSSGNGPKGAWLVYPNAFNLPPKTPFDFWNYDADVKGWYIYGQGKVSADGRQVIPNPGVYIYEFTGAMVVLGRAPGIGVPAGPPDGSSADPVNLSTGQFVYSKTDMALPGPMPIVFTRTYIANDSLSRSFGIGATNNYNILIVGDTNPYTYQELVLPDGGRIRFDRISSGTSFSDAVYEHTSTGTAFYGAQISFDSPSDTWRLKLTDGTLYVFPDMSHADTAACQSPLSITDRYGNTIQLTRGPSNQGLPTDCELQQVTSSNGRYVKLTNDGSGRITQLTDNIGRTVSYTYDGAGRLSTVTDVGGGITTYTYDDQNRMLTIKDARGLVYLTNHYDSSGRVIEQDQADLTVKYLFNWTASGNTVQSMTFGGSVVTNGSSLLSSGCWNGSSVNRYSSACSQGYLPLVAQVDVTDPRGYVREVKFGSAGYMTSDTHALGQPEQQTLTYQYYYDNTVQSVTDALGRVTSFDYDNVGNAKRVTRLDGTPNAVTSTAAFNGPFNGLTNVTDALGHATNFGYDSLGNMVTATDALNHQSTFTYSSAGQVTSATDALNNTVQFGYLTLGGDLSTVTDPLSNVNTRFADAAGRPASAIDPLGNKTIYQYNNLNLLTKVTDPQGNTTQFSYDPNGNLLTLTDARNNPTNWTYDNMDRVQTRTDPLLRQESFTYDMNGNLSSATDRKGQVTTFSYDGLNRLTFVGFNTVVNGGTTTYESTISYTYDAGNRLIQAVDTAGGTITRGYDGLDRLTSETTAQGSISYSYDNAGRRSTMQVAGQPIVNYTYDNANRLTQISQGSSITIFSYDNANRRASLTLPNGAAVVYGYDNDSRLTGLTYQFGSNTLGNLTYGYDQLGQRTQVGGSFARTGLPGAVTSATYDAANELANWNGLALSYDANGNMLSDGTNAFTWNARNQVAKLNNVSLQYDAFGRRIQNAAGTSFFYDGANAAQELSGTTVTASLLSGGIDEIFSRTDSTGAFAPLKDALGSTLALVDSSGNIQTSYTYDPYGGTSVTGTSNGNEFQYTGRESEGNGLYFYRARYYSPLLHRFISEDPLGFAGSGPNFYAYVLDSPTNFSDPLGLEVGTAPPPTDVNPTPAQIQQALQEVERASATAEVGTTTAAVATTATTTGSGPVMTLVAGGSAEGVGAGPVGVVVGAGAATLGGYGYYMGQAISAVQSANAADQELLQAIHNLNQVLLAGRKDENSGGLKPCKLVGELELPSGQVSCSYKCGHWPGALFPATCDPGQKCKAEIPGGWVSKETACE